MFELPLKGLEMVLNRCIAKDPDTLSRLQAVSGKVVKAEITDWQMNFYMLLTASGVQLVEESQQSADVVMRGPLFSLLKVAVARGSSDAMFSNGVEFQGDSELGEKIRELMARFNLDGEEWLSQYVGDTIAHQVGWGTRQFIEFGKQSTARIRDHFSNYCHYEAGYLPARQEVESFYQKISQLRDDVERAEARLNRLTKNFE